MLSAVYGLISQCCCSDIDIYDPFPSTSGGLVRPYELLTVSTNPLEWFEYSLKMYITIYIRVKVKGCCITWYEREWNFRFDLLNEGPYRPGRAPAIGYIHYGVWYTNREGWGTHLCESKGGSRGSEGEVYLHAHTRLA